MVFLSKRSVGKRGYVQREFRRVLEHTEEIPLGQIHIIPVRLDDCEVPREFTRYQWANLEEAGEFERIVEALYLGIEQRGLPVPKPSASEPLASEPKVSPEPSPTSVVTPPEAPRVVTPETFTNNIGMTFVRIAAGRFLMGSPQSDAQAHSDEKPQHEVWISEPFYLGIHPVTQGQWEAVMGSNPSRFQGDPQRPVERVSWDDVQVFLERLSERDGRAYRLPSEAQWEYACRAGSTGAYCFGDDVGELVNYAWYDANSGNTTHPVGEKQANAWGLYDMHGNVWEWCQDFYSDYQATAATDPRGPDAGAHRVIRGGCWSYSAQLVRSAYRVALGPALRVDYLGFRCSSSEASE